MRDEIITYISPKARVEFSQRRGVTPYWLNDADGIDGLENAIYTAKGVAQDGESFVSQNLSPREITITGQIHTDWRANRENLLRLINPKEAGRLVYEYGSTKRYIPCYIRNAPLFGRGIMPAYQITFFCPSPFWREGEGANENYTDLLTWENLLEWPNDELQFSESGFEIEKRTSETQINVENHGVVDTGVTIVFKASAAVVNPAIENLLTGEKLSLTYTMQDGDEIRISTGYGEKAATLTRGGVKSNVFNAVDVDSTWMQLHPGDNLLTYSADDASGLAVTIYYDSYFLGV